MSRSIEIRRLLAFGTVGALIAGCGGGGNLSEPADRVFTSLSVTASPTLLFTRPPGNTGSVTAKALDQWGNDMSGLGVPEYTSDNPGVAAVSQAGTVTAVDAGSTIIRASLTAGGTTRTASVQIGVTEGAQAATVDAPLFSFDPASIDLARGGTVTWIVAAVPHNVTFRTAGAPVSIATWSAGSRTLTFPESGTFAYECTVHPSMTGTIVVH